MNSLIKEKVAAHAGWFFVAILLLGIFFRTYDFHNLVRFNADQSRDATIISSLVNDHASLLLLGPQAGGTEFRLGPMFYYFQYTAAKIFGFQPEVLAYPDLFFSVLALIVIYCLARVLFDPPTSLLVALIASVSAYAVRYAHFAWNPNSIIFFIPLFLLALYKLSEETETWKKLLWSITAGLTIGIGFQLHTFLMVIMPFTTLVFFGYLWKKQLASKKLFFIVCAAAILMNVPQGMYELQSHGQNIQEFFKGLHTKSSSNESGRVTNLLGTNLAKNASCTLEASWNIITALGTNDQCGTDKLFSISSDKKSANQALGIASGITAILFFIGGVILFIQSYKQETQENRRRFFFLLSAFSLITFFFFLLFAQELSIRYFNILFFVPLFLLGLWIDFFWKFTQRKTLLAAIPLVIVLVFSILNIQTSLVSFDLSRTSFDNTSLGEAEFLSNFIVSHTPTDNVAVIDSKPENLFKFLKSVQFLASRESQTPIFRAGQEPDNTTNITYFYVGGKSLPKKLQGTSVDAKTFGHFTIHEVSR